MRTVRGFWGNCWFDRTPNLLSPGANNFQKQTFLKERRRPSNGVTPGSIHSLDSLLRNL